MLCDGCGTAVQPGQAFCSRCGKQVVGPVTAFQPRRSRVQEHVHLLGILWLAVSALTTIGAVVLFIIAKTLSPHLHEMGAPPEMPTKFLHVFLSVIALFVLVKAAAGFITGWGLLHREPWGAGSGAGYGIYLAVQYSVRHGGGRIYHVGSIAGCSATGVRRPGRVPRCMRAAALGSIFYFFFSRTPRLVTSAFASPVI